MPRTITKTVYTFQELLDLHTAGKATEKAVQKARQWLQEVQTDGEWYDATYDCWKEALEQIGLCEPEISFRGFSSQGDGASFTARIDIAKLAGFLAVEIEPKNCIEGNPEDFRPWIVHKCGSKTTDPKYRQLARIGDWLDKPEVRRTSSHYCHERTCEVSLSVYGDHRCPSVDKLLRQFAKDAETLRLALCKTIYRDLEDEYEYLTSDDALLELARGNDYTFTISGVWEQ